MRVVELGAEETQGVAVGIDEDGALRIRRDDGSETRVVAGDVTLAKEPT